MMTVPTLVVLAAGMGSRYGGLKQMDSVGPAGTTMMDYALFDAVRAGFGKVVFVIRDEFAAMFREQIGERYRSHVSVDYAYQELDRLPDGFGVPEGRVKPWGTGHAVLVCREVVDGPFAVINADDFYGRAGFEAMAEFLKSPDDDGFCMVGYPVRNTLSDHGSVSRGWCEVDEEGTLRSVTETHGIRRHGGEIIADHTDPPGGTVTLTGDEIVSMNFWGFRPTIFTHLADHFAAFLDRDGERQGSEFYLPAVVDGLIADGAARVTVLECESAWFGVTYRDDKPRVQAALSGLVEAGVYPSPLWDDGRVG